MSETEANITVHNVPSGRRVHLTCSGLTRGGGRLSESGSLGEFLGALLSGCLPLDLGRIHPPTAAAFPSRDSHTDSQ